MLLQRLHIFFHIRVASLLAFVVEVTLNQRLICDGCTWWPQRGATIVSVKLPWWIQCGQIGNKKHEKKKRLNKKDG